MSCLDIKGQQFVFFDDELYRFCRRDKYGNLIMDHVDTDTVATFKDFDLAQALCQGRAKLMADDPRSARSESVQPPVPPFDHAPEADQAEALRRRKYVEAVRQLETRSCEADIRRKLAEVADEMGDLKGPGVRTAREWRARYERANCKLEALLPQHARKGNRLSRFPAKVHFLAEKAIQKAYAIEERPTLVQAYATFLLFIEEENKGRLGTLQLPEPSYNAFREIVKKYDQYALTARRHGKRAAKLAYGRTKPGLQMSFPLERVEVDHQVLDLIAVSDDPHVKSRRPILTVAIDHYSRMVTGYTLSYTTDIGTVLSCLKRSIIAEPPRYDDDGAPLTDETWDCYGVPLAFGFDNGPEFHSTAVTHALYKIGSGAEYTRSYTPEHKGVVERFFGTVSTQFCKGLPGYTFSNPGDRADYAAHIKARLNLEQIDRHLHHWIVDDYGRTPHSTTGEPPLDRFRRGVHDRKVRMVDASELVPFSGRTEERAITRQGVRINNRFYQAPELTDILASSGFDGDKTKVTVYASDTEKERVWIYHPIKGRPFEALYQQQAAAEVSAEQRERNKHSKKSALLALAKNRESVRAAASKNKKKVKNSGAKQLPSYGIEVDPGLAAGQSFLESDATTANEDEGGKIDVDYGDLDLSW